MRWFRNLGYRVWGIGSGEKTSDVARTAHTPNPIPHTQKFRHGFGLIEVLAAAVVLGFLIVGLTRLQLGNREVVLRIRARDAAQIVAQDFIDSLSRQGISSIETGDIPDIKKEYEWTGQNNKNDQNKITSKITYTIGGKIADEDALNSVERSNFTDATGADTTHFVAKKVDLTVSWLSKGSTQSISVSRILK